MLAVYKYDDTEKQLRKQARIEPDVWINAIDPTPDELATLQAKTHVPEAFLLYGLDEDESARFEYDEDADASLIIFDNPTVTRDDHRNFAYETDPLAIILTKRAIITINKTDVPLLTQFSDNRVSHFNPRFRQRAALQIMYQVTVSYLTYLREINKHRIQIERQLQRNLKNQELFGLMGIQRSLVYFMMSLRTDRNVLENLKRANTLHLDEDDLDYLDDIMIENQQGMEMASISNSIINETADTYSSVINNNMNGVMKMLTSYSIILTVPTLVFSFYGMNVKLPFAGDTFSWITTIGISALIAIVLAIQFWHRKLF
ncbi:magnesium transporter CorA family protein [Lacticaseibacillus saniviri]|uniref:MIT family metal ion transporter CorA n=1 Tax=Lacticaseibacillus saniviri JCM 17471 = DSM 24301 TaxID=1293598 RepID=A0A0R2MY66_9LACO|nr:magnesium transporter CorA family protein [Lacticaseibacillus saniviri]KRO16781.1 MIT family metal ion transporter CorA [Lacticaseibacillus saniviri JCM 17471 = DSM 24301]MCG4281763.1 magnesium transporter CorA family protein [Lacticaseibacillus saniviri]